MARIEVVEEADLPELLTLMRGYCDFYEVAPSDKACSSMGRALIADPGREGCSSSPVTRRAGRSASRRSSGRGRRRAPRASAS